MHLALLRLEFVLRVSAGWCIIKFAQHVRTVSVHARHPGTSRLQLEASRAYTHQGTRARAHSNGVRHHYSETASEWAVQCVGGVVTPPRRNGAVTVEKQACFCFLFRGAGPSDPASERALTERSKTLGPVQ